ncbi:MAG: hypothetical protein P4L74_02250 [Candidatus Doudnabacteria bacterium]|nr:hypothetical protein [Candidatus Doudnabacteria bacterium]
MNSLYLTIGELYARKEKLDRAIAALEALQAQGEAPSTKRRGRKFMPAEERKIVSERLQRYWAKRRESNVPLTNEQIGTRT